MAFNSPKLAMAELRHSSSIGSRASSSPMKRDEDTTPFIIPEDQPNDDDDDDDDNRHSSRDRDRPFWHNFYNFFSDDTRVSLHHSNNNKISLALLSLLLLAGFISLPLIWNRLNAPYLCKKDGIVLRCPRVKESPSLWENPYSATTSWKPCAERHDGGFS
ncbi:O-fucosyltransferase, partial [Thalictrum thalictroides]